MNRRFAIVGIVAGMALVAYALLGSKSDEELIRERLDALEDAVHIDGDTSQANLMMRTAQLNDRFEDIFAQDVAIDIPELSTVRSGRKNLAMLAARGGQYFESLDISFSDVDIEVGNVAAEVKTLADVQAVRSGSPRRDERRVSFRFSQPDGDWLIDSVRVSPGSVE